MFLKSIELFGFKSFAEKTKIEFSKGIAALLGPNGCGKSNIVDAVKWVLGEQNTKNLRAEKMENIIFNGSESRKPLNVAEVTITFANDGNLLPLNIPEISITRRLFRSGESQYLINNNQVRLKEVRELLYDTGIGKISYAIMEQGKIDQILSNKPEERRHIFEEAAGITKYRMRSADAERKLKATEENLKQISGVMGEVVKQYESLKRQAKIAEEYKKLKESLFRVETDLQLINLRSYLEKQERLKERQSKIEKEKELQTKKIDDINIKMERSIDSVNNLESKLVELQKQIYGLDVEKDGAEKRMAMLEERIEEQQLKRNNIYTRLKYIEEKKERTEKQILKIQERLRLLNEELEKLENDIRNFERDIENYSQTMESNTKRIEDLESENSVLEVQIEQLRENLRNVTDDIVEKLDEGLKNIGYSTEKKSTIEDEISEAILSISKELSRGIDRLSGDRAVTADTLSMLRDLESRVMLLENLFKKYREYNLSFLDDFLSSEGIITLKRSIDTKIERNIANLYENRKRLSETKQNNAIIAKKLEDYRKTLSDLRIHRVKLVTESRNLESEKLRLESELEDVEREQTENQEELQSIDAAMKNLSDRIKFLETEAEEIIEKKSRYLERLNGLRKEIESKNSSLTNNESRLKKEMKRLNEIQARLEKIRIEVVENETQISNVYENFRERYSRELSDFESRMYEVKKSASELRKETGELRKRIASLGNVNLMALEEFEEVEKRYDFLNEQLADMSKAKNDLIALTSQIKKESLELFLETYNKVKKNFHLVFRRLFGGGRAEIKLTNPKNVLESGIEIYAQPPGKKLENLSLLSGGERSLTAVALLFAMYMVKPSPFCILDEIDAALDESNVEQFSQILKDFQEKSQFIIITHNKKTVAAASTLYGVTMEESGISKMIAIQIRERDEVPSFT